MKQKIVVLAEETRRCLYNQDPHHTVEQSLEVLTVFLQKLVDSSYGLKEREEILKAGIRRYLRLVLQE